MTFAESQRFKQLLIGKGGDGETREEQPKNNSAGVAKILALYVPEIERQLGGGAHWLKPPTLGRPFSNHSHELFYDRRSW